jgi:predicted DNA-binding protein YlxM (UPF0122 family)
MWKTRPSPPKGRILTDAQEKRLSTKYLEGSSIADLTRETGIGEKTVRNALRRTHTQKRTKSQAKFLFYCTSKGRARALNHSKEIRRYTVNESFFSKPLNPISAYILGFWLADGHIEKRNPNLFSISQMEEEILIEINHALQSTYRIQSSQDKGFRLSISSQQLCSNIKELCPFLSKGIKSLVADYPSIPSKLDSHFIRGVFDGDGGIYKHGKQLQLSITGTEKLNKSIQEKFIKNCHVHKTKITLHGKKLSFSRLSYSGNKQVPRIMNWIYRDAEIYIARKQKFFIDFMKKRQNMVDS